MNRMHPRSSQTLKVLFAAVALLMLPVCGVSPPGGPETQLSASGPSDGDRPSDGPTADAQQAAKTCVTIRRGLAGAVADTQIVSNADLDPPNGSFGASLAMITGQVGAGQRKALIKFDLGAIPAGATIDSATLTLHARSRPPVAAP